MKILWFNWRDIRNPDAGGAEVFTHEIGKRLVKMGHQITLFTSAFENAKKEEEIDGIKIVRDGNKYSVYGRAKDYYKKNKDQFDLVIDEINTKPFLTPTFVKDKPIIAIIHQLAREFWFYETRFPLNVLGYYFLEKYWLRKYTDIPMVTVSESTKNGLINLGLKKVHVITQGLDVKALDSLPEKESKPTLLFVGRFKKAKKPDDAIKAFTIVKRNIPDAQLWMVGDGYMMQDLRKLADHGIDNNGKSGKDKKIIVSSIDEDNMQSMENNVDSVTFYGRISSQQKLELMAKAHLLLMPGVREGWGLVVTEANMMGTPAIAYDVPGLRDSVVDKVTGQLIPRNDYVAMAIAAVELLKDESKRNTYSRNAIKWAQKFNWDRTTNEFADILDGYVRRYTEEDLIADEMQKATHHKLENKK